eukprot:gene2086-biopygen952
MRGSHQRRPPRAEGAELHAGEAPVGEERRVLPHRVADPLRERPVDVRPQVRLVGLREPPQHLLPRVVLSHRCPPRVVVDREGASVRQPDLRVRLRVGEHGAAVAVDAGALRPRLVVRESEPHCAAGRHAQPQPPGAGGVPQLLRVRRE